MQLSTFSTIQLELHSAFLRAETCLMISFSFPVWFTQSSHLIYLITTLMYSPQFDCKAVNILLIRINSITGRTSNFLAAHCLCGYLCFIKTPGSPCHIPGYLHHNSLFTGNAKRMFHPLKRWIIYVKIHGDQRFFRFEIIINVLISSLRFIWIPMLWVYDHCRYCYFYSAAIDFRRQNLTSTDVRFWRLKLIPAL